jgi:TIGR03009 family protein
MRLNVRKLTSKFAVALLGSAALPLAVFSFTSPLCAQQPQSGAGYANPAARYAGGQAPATAQQIMAQQYAQSATGQATNGPSPQAQAPQAAGAQVANPQAAAPQAATPQASGGQPLTDPGGLVNPVAPFPALNAEWQAYLDKVLDAWEKKTSEFSRFSCTFKRYQFDPTLVQAYPYTMALGSIKYMKPDQGLFRADQLVYYSGLDNEQKPQYKENPQKKFGEYWICDGQYVHVLDQNEKKCTKYELPPAMRGNAIYLSPLPFLFGVKAEDIKSRYWIRPLPLPKDRTNEVWLEAFPRRADDAANYQKVQVVLDLKDFMPKGLIVFLPNWREEAQHREVYEFSDRRTNETLLEKLDLFKKEFIPKDLPEDWKVIIEPYQAPQAAPSGETPRVATPPAMPSTPLR